MPTPAFIVKLRHKIGNDLLLVPTVVVIARDASGRLLLVKDRDSGQWTLPGGIVEPDEIPANAAVREVWEEAGLTVELQRLLGVVGGPACGGTYSNGDQLAWVASLFSATITGGVLAADGQETSEARLVDPAEVARLVLHRHSRRFLEVEQQAGSAAFFDRPTWRP